MDSNLFFLLSVLFIVAFLYSSVGHGGASGYLATMALWGIAPAELKPTALCMNIAVSLISFIGFYRAGHFKFKLFWPFALASIPMAFLGGTISLSDPVYKLILGISLLIAITRMIFNFTKKGTISNPPPLWAALLSGGSIGLISGMIGIGGGILLSPLLLLMNWGKFKEVASVSALFIFVNSISGLVGLIQKEGISINNHLQLSLAVAVLGGLFGTYYGSKVLKISALNYALAVGLFIAALKLIFIK